MGYYPLFKQIWLTWKTEEKPLQNSHQAGNQHNQKLIRGFNADAPSVGSERTMLTYKTVHG